MAARAVTPAPAEPAGLDARLRVTRDTFRLELDLAIPPGRTAALLGPNGAGKSTAVWAIAGLLALDGGHVRLAGETLDDPAAGRSAAPDARRMGVVFQDGLLFGHMTAIENVAFGLRSRGVAGADARARARAWLERLGVGEHGEREPGSLSGGQAQRVALARALAVEPRLLLLDEPLSALDVTARASMRRVLAEHLASFAGPRLLITHDPTEAFLLADEIHVIEGGAITQSGTADEIRRRPLTPYAADLSGTNLVAGVANDGAVDTGTHRLVIADATVGGPVLAIIPAAAIALHRREPEGSPRNAWRTRVELVERIGDRVRVTVGGPVRLTAEVTEAAVRDLALVAGLEVWASVKATEIEVLPSA